ncbi:hypothetical protein THAR02_10737 [Trichoderma harzianum]|uniref:NACHT domain-containing protein n=1 Tax=Trichoderma harzianum TaxID=5544 RepID=A0A0F9X8R4_TRIHA|nr:hypothetical protein THAR02_10737 [Trichoderma harzianum]
MTNTIVESPAYGQNYLRFENYTIGWICALPVEAECALYMLDVRHRGIFPFVHGDDNQYEAGKIAGHNVVIASLPKKSIGSVSVATLASQMRQSFRNLRYGLMVGIGAGVPGRALKPDIRLGDVIVASSSDQSIGPVGVIGYELGAETVDGFIRKGWQPETHRRLRTAIESIERDAEIDDFYDFTQHLSDLQKRRNGHKFLYPGMDKDKLYVGDYTDNLIERPPRRSPEPVVHYGLVASGDKIIKNAALRDRLRDQYGIICFEMEAAGLMAIMPVAVIRGVSDYADSHKNDGWHYYAAATAAAYAKSLLLKIGPEQPPSISDNAPNFDSNLVLTNEKEDCLHSLVFQDMLLRRQNIALDLLGACDWIFENSAFIQWREQDDFKRHNGVLWIKGNPGAGKSTLMKHIWANCDKSFADCFIATYFFNTRGHSLLEKTFLGMLRSLLYQLLATDEAVYKRFITIFREKQKIYRRIEWHESELQDFLFLEMRQYRSRRLLFIIDALDECTDSDRLKVVEFLESISINPGTNLWICLSSRHYPNITIKKRLEIVVERSDEHRRGIAKYIKSKLKQKSSEIQNRILKKAAGIFMWVILVVAKLNEAYDRGQVEVADMRETLDQIPSDLEDLFQTLLNKDDGNKAEMMLMLQWVLYSMRPLKPEELYCAVRYGMAARNGKTSKRSTATIDDMRRRITSSSRGLIEIREGANVVQFIHQSVEDFLVRYERMQKIDPSLGQNATFTSHDRLRACCLECVATEGANGRAKGAPFLQYASRYLLDHAERAQTECNVKWLHRPHLWFNQWKRILSSSEEYPFLKYDTEAGLLNVLLLRGYYNLFRIALLGKGADINAQGGLFGNSLQVAIVKREDTIAIELLEKGADINLEGGFFGNALQAAISKGSEEIIAILIEKRAVVNAQEGIFGNALQAAAVRGDIGIVELLLKNGADINAQGGIFGSALQAAVAKGNEKIVALLLEKGVNIDAQGGIFGNALQAALAARRESLALTLFKDGADFNASGGISDMVLLIAAAYTQGDIVKTLLEKGSIKPTLSSDMMDVDLECGPALLWAVRNGHENLVKWLLKRGANVNAKSEFGKITPSIIRIKAQRGASVQFDSGKTALLCAASQGHESMVRLLLENAADVMAKDNAGRTALSLAASNGHEAVVRLLLENGADITAKDNAGRTALCLAAAQGWTKVVQLLLANDPNANSQAMFEVTEIWNQPFQSLSIQSISVHFATRGARAKIQIKSLVMNGGSLYLAVTGASARLEIGNLIMNGGSLFARVDGGDAKCTIETLQMIGGILHMESSGGAAKCKVEKLEMRGGSLYLNADGGGAGVRIGILKLSGGEFSLNADGGGAEVNIERLETSDGSSTLAEMEMVHMSNGKGQEVLQGLYGELTNGRKMIYETTSTEAVSKVPEGTRLSIGGGPTPLHMAAENGHAETVVLLLANGADSNARWGKLSPLQLAGNNLHNPVTQLLIPKRALFAVTRKTVTVQFINVRFIHDEKITTTTAFLAVTRRTSSVQFIKVQLIYGEKVTTTTASLNATRRTDSIQFNHEEKIIKAAFLAVTRRTVNVQFIHDKNYW